MARRLLVAGSAVAFVRWLASPIEIKREPVQAPTPERLSVRDDWEFPHRGLTPLRRRRRRLATTLVFTAIFFAGAAFAAGAGNEVARVADDSTVATDTTTTDTTAAATDATPATTADAAPTPAPAPAPAPAPDPTPAPAPASDPTPAPATQTPAPTPAADTTPAPAAADPAPADTATTTPDASAPDPSDIVVKPSAPAVAPTPTPAAAPANHAAPRIAKKQSSHRTAAKHAFKQNLPVLVIPYHAIAFDPQQWLNDNPGTPTGQAAVSIAMNYLGVPYRWGGAVPATGFDCSGLTRFVYAQLGINLVHYAASQFAAFPKLDPAQLQPGDLVFFEPKFDGPGHVGLYIGHDQMIEAPHTGAVVRIQSVSAEAAAIGFLGAVRPYSNPAPDLALVSAVEWGPAAAFARLQ